MLAAPLVAALGAWLEQLVAESTGKDGRGIVPVADEPLGAPAVYGADRVFVALALEGHPQPRDRRALGGARRRGPPGAPLDALGA